MEFLGLKPPKTEDDVLEFGQPEMEQEQGGENTAGTPDSPDSMMAATNVAKREATPKSRINKTVQEMSSTIRQPLGFKEQS